MAKSYKKELLDRAESAIERGPKTESFRLLGSSVFRAIRDEVPDREDLLNRLEQCAEINEKVEQRKALEENAYYPSVALTVREGVFIANLLYEESRSCRLTLEESNWRKSLACKIHPNNPKNKKEAP